MRANGSHILVHVYGNSVRKHYICCPDADDGDDIDDNHNYINKDADDDDDYDDDDEYHDGVDDGDDKDDDDDDDDNDDDDYVGVVVYRNVVVLMPQYLIHELFQYCWHMILF